jgi:RNA polymerase sigma-70 factor (ECF subfamily)
VPHFEGNAKESTWVFRVALNTAAVWTRRESRYRTRMESRSDLDGVIHEEVRGRNERLDWLYDEIRKLDAVNRSLMLLVLEGYSYQDVAEQLGITASNVGVKLNRLKKQLARIAKGVAQ